MKWNQLLDLLKSSLPLGSITTYGELSEHLFGHREGGQSVRSMLQAAVDSDFTNSRFTNRVIYTNGKVADVNGQIYQLEAEGIEIKDNRVDLSKVKLVTF